MELIPRKLINHELKVVEDKDYPIVSDSFYAGRKTARNDRVWCPRLFLHAGSISFLHPQTKVKVDFKTDIPEELRETLDKLSQVA